MSDKTERRYDVRLDPCFYQTITVTAINKEEAKKKAFEKMVRISSKRSSYQISVDEL